MKKFKIILGLAAALMAEQGLSYGATTQTVNAVASVQSTADLTISVFEGQNTCGPGGTNCYSSPAGVDVYPNMNFGNLTGDPTLPWSSPMGSDKYFLVFLGANTSSRPYTIKATMSPFSNGSVELPRQASAATIHASINNADIAGDSYSSAPASAVMSNQVVYTSNASGTPAVVQMLYAIPRTGSGAFSGAEIIPPHQQGGTYAATVTYTLVVS